MTDAELYATTISLSPEEVAVVLAALRTGIDHAPSPVEVDILKRVELRLIREWPGPHAHRWYNESEEDEPEVPRTPRLTMPEWGGF
jgi:hypothetical protein